MIFVIAQDKFNASTLKGMVDRLIVIEPCEPDPAWEFAVSITHVSQGYFSASPGKLFCQFNQVPNAFPEVTWEPFINADPEVRVQWHMRQKGCSKTDIAEVVGCHKSTVGRNLKHTPEKLDSWLSEDELDELAAAILGNKPQSPKTPTAVKDTKAESNDDDEDCNWDDPDDDEDALAVPKQQPKRKKTRW